MGPLEMLWRRKSTDMNHHVQCVATFDARTSSTEEGGDGRRRGRQSVDLASALLDQAFAHVDEVEGSVPRAMWQTLDFETLVEETTKHASASVFTTTPQSSCHQLQPLAH